MKLPSAQAVRGKLFELAQYALIGGGVYLLASRWMSHSSGPKEGTTAAAFDLPLAGQTGRVSLAAQHGKPVIMEVFASWCSACQRTTPRLVETFQTHQHDDVTFLAVSVDEDPNAAARVKSAWHIPFDVAVDDGSVSRGYGVTLLPTLIYIDAQGKVKHASAGITSRSDLEDWLSER